jgi:hypothetical protein
MAATVYSNLFTAFDVPPGGKFSFEWRNIPQGKAYAIDAQPYNPGSYQEGYNNTTEVEVTRFWRRTRSIQKQGSIGVTVEVHNDVLGEIKNIGPDKLDCAFNLIVFM